MRKRTSFFWKIPLEDFKKVISSSNSIAEILRHYGFVAASGNYKTIKKRLQEENIDYSHIKLGLSNNKGRTFSKRAIPLEEVMIENSTYSRKNLKRRLLKKGLIQNKCSICGQGEIWNNQKIVMVLDHINGVNNDHRLKNLRMLCPNCNSQQETFCGRKGKTKKYYCKKCGKKRNKNAVSELCKDCFNFSQRKINRPNKEQLQKNIKELGYCKTGRKYGVSDNTIRKWLK